MTIHGDGFFTGARNGTVKVIYFFIIIKSSSWIFVPSIEFWLAESESLGALCFLMEGTWDCNSRQYYLYIFGRDETTYPHSRIHQLGTAMCRLIGLKLRNWFKTVQDFLVKMTYIRHINPPLLTWHWPVLKHFILVKVWKLC